MHNSLFYLMFSMLCQFLYIIPKDKAPGPHSPAYFSSSHTESFAVKIAQSPGPARFRANRRSLGIGRWIRGGGVFQL